MMKTTAESYPLWGITEGIEISKQADLDALNALEYKYVVIDSNGCCFWEKAKNNRVIMIN